MKHFGYYLDFWTMPVIALALMGSVASWPWVVAGYVLWVFLEYYIHLVVFHKAYRRDHWKHHTEPENREEAISPIASHLTLLFTLVFMGLDVTAGLLIGYLTYIYAHHGMHHGWFSRGNPVFGSAIRRHDLHHMGKEVNFNFLVPLGDWVFRTYESVPKLGTDIPNLGRV